MLLIIFKTIFDFSHTFRFANIPDIIELDHLTVSGDVTFGRGVSLRVSNMFPLNKNKPSPLP